MSDRQRPRSKPVQRGPLISERRVISKQELESYTQTPQQVFNVLAGTALEHLIERVGYQHKITITIEPLKKEHPESPGWEIAAKMRRP
jgi:hypothetical protein